MEVRITSRHSTLSESLRDRAEDLLSKLNKYGARISVVEMIFDEDCHEKLREIFQQNRSVEQFATLSWAAAPGCAKPRFTEIKQIWAVNIFRDFGRSREGFQLYS